MAVALIATLAFVPSLPKPKRPVSPIAPLKALRHRGLLTMGIMALLYNWGFFTMLGYAPYPMELDAHELGLVFTGWGLLVAAFSVFFAPRLQARFGTAPVLYANLLGLGIVMAIIAAGVSTPTVVIVAVIVSGAFIGINNTLTTQAVMLVSPVERPVASSAYGFLRFIGGGLAPFAMRQARRRHRSERPVLARRRHLPPRHPRPGQWPRPAAPGRGAHRRHRARDAVTHPRRHPGPRE